MSVGGGGRRHTWPQAAAARPVRTTMPQPVERAPFTFHGWVSRISTPRGFTTALGEGTVVRGESATSEDACETDAGTSQMLRSNGAGEGTAFACAGEGAWGCGAWAKNVGHVLRWNAADQPGHAAEEGSEPGVAVVQVHPHGHAKTRNHVVALRSFGLRFRPAPLSGPGGVRSGDGTVQRCRTTKHAATCLGHQRTNCHR